jgi:hypothetical protein
MFPFTELKREYRYQNSARTIFNRLNALTYKNSLNTLDGNITVADHPTFELYHPNEWPQTSKPLATKVTVTILTENCRNQVIARTATNPLYWILLVLVTISGIVQIFREPSFMFIGFYLVLITGLVYWDRRIKKKTLERLERVLPEPFKSYEMKVRLVEKLSGRI